MAAWSGRDRRRRPSDAGEVNGPDDVLEEEPNHLGAVDRAKHDAFAVTTVQVDSRQLFARVRRTKKFRCKRALPKAQAMQRQERAASAWRSGWERSRLCSSLGPRQAVKLPRNSSIQFLVFVFTDLDKCQFCEHPLHAHHRAGFGLKGQTDEIADGGVGGGFPLPGNRKQPGCGSNFRRPWWAHRHLCRQVSGPPQFQ